MKKKKKLPDKLPRPKENISGLPQKWAFRAYNRRAPEVFKQQPFLQHQLSTEGKKPIKLKLLYQHPLNPPTDETNTPLISNPLNMPDEIAARLSWYLNAVKTQPTMANRSDMDAPTPFRPTNKGQQ